MKFSVIVWSIFFLKDELRSNLNNKLSFIKMPCCAIRTCRVRRNSAEAKRENISFHKFPKNPQKRLEWVNKIDRPGWVPNDATVVCSKHFTVLDFLGSSKGNKLLKGAIPTLHLHDHVDERTMATKAKERRRRVPKTKNQLAKTSTTELQEQEDEDIENGPTSEYDAAFEDDKSMDIPLVDIKIETIGEPTNDPELLAQERMVIVEIVKSIMCSLDLLVKSDPDSLRSTNVRDKIIAALFCYHHIVDDKDLNLALYKETDIFDINDSEPAKAIETVVYDEKKDEEMEDSNLFDDFNEDDFPDEDYEEEDFLTDEEDDEWKSLKSLRDKIKSKKNLVEKPPKKNKNIESLRTIKKLVQIFQNKDVGKIDKAKKKNKNVDRVKRKYKKRGSKQNEMNRSEETTESLVHSKVKDEIKKNGVPFESVVPRFVCEICDVTVVSEHHLAVHKLLCRRRHFYYGNPKLEDFWNDVKCPLCDVKCNHRGNLGRHYITHRVKDIESAFAPLKEKHLNPNDAEKNMRLLNDFILEFERLDEENEEKFNNSIQPSNEQNADGTNNIVDNVIKSENANEHKKQTKKISHYLKFNLKKIVYDIDFDKDLYCYSCDLLFNNKDELEVHKKKVNDTDAFVCNHCDKTFDTPTKLIHHAKTHTGLYNKNSLYLHNNSEDMEGCPRQMDFKLYPCKYCLTLYMRDDALRAHRTFYGRHANMRCSLREKPAVKRRRRPIILPPGSIKTNDGKYHCNQCAKDYKNYYLFMEHMASHSDVYSFFCDCGKGFKTKKRLKFHIELVHNKKFDVICEICGLKVLYSSLRRHRKAHSTVKPYTCNYCSKGFKYQDALRGHIRTHTHEKLWKCQYCGVEFAEKRGYNTHINIHEGKTPYKCKLCPSAFVSKLKLNAHVAEHRDCRNNTM